MKKALFLLLFLTGCTSCAVHVPKISPGHEFVDNDTRGVMRLIGRWSAAHACPVDGVVLTAAHVISPFHKIPLIAAKPIGYSWSDSEGRQGYVVGAVSNVYRDLGVLRLRSGEPFYYRHAEAEPSNGDLLQWLEYRFDSDQRAYESNLKTAKLIRTVSGHLMMDTSPTRGASGSCVFNDQNEVAGILVWGVGTGTGKIIGVAVSVSGPWWPESPALESK